MIRPAARRTSTSSTGLLSAADRRRATELVLELMEIPGRSGEEALVADAIRRHLLAAGADPRWLRDDGANRRTTLKGQVGNQILKLPGTLRQPRRMLSAHMDTVPICMGAIPRRTGRLVASANKQTGLGADDRAGCAVVLWAVTEMLRRGLPHPPLTACWFVQEEIGLHGARHVNLRALGNPALAFNWDGGSAAKVTIGATGGYRMSIDVHGIASHAGAAPEQGVSAIAIAALAIADLQCGGWHGDIRRDGCHGTSNVGVIQGGDATNVVTDRVQLRVEARSHDPQFRQRIVREIAAAFERAAAEVRNVRQQCGKVSIEGRLDYESFCLDANAPVVRLAQQAVVATGGQPELAISNGGLDANWLNAHGIATVTLGCGQVHPHMTSEQLNLDEFERACGVALHYAALHLGAEQP